MEELQGRVAVVTGGAGGIGRALCEAFVAEGMHVVVADVDGAGAERTASEIGGVGERVDVSDSTSVEALAERVYERFGACHVLCNNAGVGAPSALAWETTVNDWRWVHGVNVLGVVHGVLTFVPRMLAGGDEGHVVNTSSTDGGVSPLPAASVYASSKAAVSTFTECLAAQLVSEGTRLRASIFYPSGGLLRTGLWTSERTRPPELARERPRTTEPMTIERLEELAVAGGYELPWQDLHELARVVVDGIRAERFVLMKDNETIGPMLHTRADALAGGALPAHDQGPLG